MNSDEMIAPVGFQSKRALVPTEKLESVIKVEIIARLTIGIAFQALGQDSRRQNCSRLSGCLLCYHRTDREGI